MRGCGSWQCTVIMLCTSAVKWPACCLSPAPPPAPGARATRPPATPHPTYHTAAHCPHPATLSPSPLPFLHLARRDEAKAHGEDSLPPHLLITSARSKHKDAAGASVVRDAVAAFLSAHGSPFTAVADAPGSNKLEAPGAEVGKWLLADSLAEPLALFASRTGEDEAQVRGAGGCGLVPDCLCACLLAW